LTFQADDYVIISAIDNAGGKGILDILIN